jgi:hypothetical protein
MPYKRHIFFCLVLFISCSTSIRDQVGQEAAVALLPVKKSVTSQVLLANVQPPE